MRTRSPNRTHVSARTVGIVAAGVAAKHGVAVEDVRNTMCKKPAVVAARREAWRLLATDEKSIHSIARAWPCHHTGILWAIDGKVK